jgi:hypothetical protein
VQQGEEQVMEYRIECMQTVFGKERERRLKLAFDIIWSLDIQKARVGSPRCDSQNPYSPMVAGPVDEVEGESNEAKKNLLSEAEQEL